ncbi:hypothetical protein U14_01902 [Candidatus Moduliflexus flocculans]|uniref:Uncharacterized protein n=1 Tax=Candidatus Moduliflexus flocculans TaxID=1499966 RepID=A0A0S6VT34_9BACT|nr:hypothetical protein U14_01902 [Candidatus Moduliflexus flocculans]
MGRRWYCDWQHSEQELFQVYHHATNGRLLPRLQALWQLRRGRSLAEVATLIGDTYRTVQTWVTWYRQGGLAEVTRHRQGGVGAEKIDRCPDPGTESPRGYRGISDAMGCDSLGARAGWEHVELLGAP